MSNSGNQLSYFSPQVRPKSIKRLVWILAIGALCLIGAIVFSIVRNDPLRNGEIGRCAANLSQIVKACVIYANENQNVFPTDVALLVRDVDLVTDVFVCHMTDATKARDDVPFNELKAALATPQHNSYVYCGDGLKNLSGARDEDDLVIAYERPTNHDVNGCYVAFADGHVEFIVFRRNDPSDPLSRMIKDAESGVRPVRFKP